MTEDISTISSFERPNKSIIDKLNLLKDLFKIDSSGIKRSKHISENEIDSLYDDLNALIDKKNKLIEEKNLLQEYKDNLEVLDRYGIDVAKIKNLNYFDHRFGEVSKDGRYILKNNYDNLPSLILHLDGSLDDMSLGYLDELIALDKETSKLRTDTDNIISNEKANTFNVISALDKKYSSLTKNKSDEVYSNILSEGELRKNEIEKEYKQMKDKLDRIYENHSEDIVSEISSSILEEGTK